MEVLEVSVVVEVLGRDEAVMLLKFPIMLFHNDLEYAW